VKDRLGSGEFPDVRDPAWMLSAFLTGGKQEISARQPSRNSPLGGVAVALQSRENMTGMLLVMCSWHLADIPKLPINVRFRG
jgi:hypothetical protein